MSLKKVHFISCKFCDKCDLKSQANLLDKFRNTFVAEYMFGNGSQIVSVLALMRAVDFLSIRYICYI